MPQWRARVATRGAARGGTGLRLAEKELGKGMPDGVYDEAMNTGWVSVGMDHDTAEFAVETLRRWWRQMGSRSTPGRSGY